MSATFFDLMKYASTGIASPSMTAYDKARALVAFGGGKMQTLTGIPPISFVSKTGKPLISWSMLGNGEQSGTPTPDAPIMPEFVGKKVGADWTIPISCGGQTTPVYLGQVQTVRRVKKLVLTGEETEWTYPSAGVARIALTSESVKTTGINNAPISTHYIGRFSDSNGSIRILSDATKLNIVDTVNATDSTTWTTYLADQYAAGTPVTIWYVLATPETGIVNEPLCKIGDYADELHSEDAGVTIPTAKGSNTLTVETDLQPSSMSVTGPIKPS